MNDPYNELLTRIAETTRTGTKWHLFDNCIRTMHGRKCPLAVVLNWPTNFSWERCSYANEVIDNFLEAADNANGHAVALRVRLLHACGLVE